MSRCLAIIAFLFANGISAYSEFSTTCSIPPADINYVTSPNTRGTLDILWSCFFTIIACTWTIQHLNLPEQRGNRDPGFRGNVKWIAKGLWSNSKWMLATMIAPEYILGKALADLQAAYSSVDFMRDFAIADDVEWGLTQGFLANMGGFVIVQKRTRKVDEEGMLHDGEPLKDDSNEDKLEKSEDDKHYGATVTQFNEIWEEGTEKPSGEGIHRPSEPVVTSKKEANEEISPLPLDGASTIEFPSKISMPVLHSKSVAYSKDVKIQKKNQEPSTIKQDTSELVKGNIWGSTVLRAQSGKSILAS